MVSRPRSWAVTVVSVVLFIALGGTIGAVVERLIDGSWPAFGLAWLIQWIMTAVLVEILMSWYAGRVSRRLDVPTNDSSSGG